MSKFLTTITVDNNHLYMKFSGVLDEHSTFGGDTLPAYDHMHLDLLEIGRITSKGIRLWKLWIAKLDQTKKYSFTQCSKSFIAHANLVPGMIPAWADVLSIELPYYCDICGRTFGVMIK